MGVAGRLRRTRTRLDPTLAYSGVQSGRDPGLTMRTGIPPGIIYLLAGPNRRANASDGNKKKKKCTAECLNILRARAFVVIQSRKFYTNRMNNDGTHTG